MFSPKKENIFQNFIALALALAEVDLGHAEVKVAPGQNTRGVRPPLFFALGRTWIPLTLVGLAGVIIQSVLE